MLTFMPDNTGLISIILPVFNREKTVARAIDSVLYQTDTQWELIIVDDCSTDGTYKKLISYKDNRIRILKATKNSGAAAARNLGISASQGAFITFLDSDDHYEPQFLEAAKEKFRTTSSSVGIIWTGYTQYRQIGNELKTKENIWTPDRNKSPYHTFLHELRIGIGTGITIRKEVFNTIGLFDESLPAAEDTDLFLRIAQQYSFDYIDQYLININQVGKDRLSRRFDKIATAYNIIVPKHLKQIEKVDKLRSKYYYKGMWLNYHLGDQKIARRYFKLIRSEDHVHFKAWIIFFLFEIFGTKIGSSIHVLMASLDRD